MGPALALAALALLVLPAASCSTSTSTAAQRSTKTPAPTKTAKPGTSATGQVAVPVTWPGADWKHVGVVLGYLDQTPPQLPIVTLLGGSAARECTISDADWRAEIGEMGGGDVLAFNLGATNQSFDDNIGMVENMPKAPALVLIGINLGRYTRSATKPYEPPTVPEDLTLGQVDDYPQHRFDSHHIMPDERKLERLSDYWFGERQVYFDENFDYNSGRLRDLLDLCERRGYGVVLFNLPLNLQTVAGHLDEQRERYRKDCQAAAEEYGVPYVDFVADVPFVSRDFADNWHLVEAGRVKWQRELSGVTAKWLSRYGMTSSASPASGQ